MPYLDIISFTCLDESEFGSDEVYAVARSRDGRVQATNTIGGMDSNETAYPNFAPMYFSPNGGYIDVTLWEEDGGGQGGDDDRLGSTLRIGPYDSGHVERYTLQGSGGTYTLAWEII